MHCVRCVHGAGDRALGSGDALVAAAAVTGGEVVVVHAQVVLQHLRCRGQGDGVRQQPNL